MQSNNKMEYKAKITLSRDGDSKEESLGTYIFIHEPEVSSELSIQEDIHIENNTPISIGSALASNGNLSVAVFHNGIQHLLALTRWDSIDPYIGLYIPDLGWLGIHFYDD